MSHAYVAEKMMAECMDDNDGTGEMCCPDSVVKLHEKILKDAGLEHIRFHDLRHSAVSTLRKGGCDAKDIQAWLGHSDVSTTLNVYGHVLRDDMSRLRNVVDTALFQGAKAG